MNAEEVIDLLTLAASFDRRTVGKADVQAWLLVVGDLPFTDAQHAVARHYGETRDWLMPSDVRRLVRKIREDRIDAAKLPAPSPEAADDEAEYRRALRNIRSQIGDGRMPFRAIEPGPANGPSSEFIAKRSPEDRDRVLAQTVPCPCDWCPALANERCTVSVDGDRVPLAKWHPSRMRAAKANTADREAS